MPGLGPGIHAFLQARSFLPLLRRFRLSKLAGSSSAMVKLVFRPSGPQTWTGVSGSANSAMRWRQPPQGVTSFGPPATTAIARIFLAPPSTIAEIAEVSAQTPFGYAAFSTLPPE